LKEHLAHLETSTNIWGVSPETVFLYISDIERGTNELADAINLEVIRNNAFKDEALYKRGLKWLCDYLGFLRNDGLSPLGKILLVEKDPLPIIQACIFNRDYRIHSFLTDVITKRIHRVEFSELENYFPGEANVYLKLLASFNFLIFKRKTIVLNIPTVRRTAKVLKFSRDVENWLCAKSFWEALVGSEDETLVSELAAELLGILGVPFEEDTRHLTIVEALKHIGNVVPELSDTIITNSETLIATLKKVHDKFSEANENIRSHVQDSRTSATSTVRINEEKLEFVAREYGVKPEKLRKFISQFLSLQSRTSRVYLPYVENSLSVKKTTLMLILAKMFEDNVRIDESFVYFLKRLRLDAHKDENPGEYWQFILHEYSKNEGKIRKLKSAQNYLVTNCAEFTDIIQSNVRMVKNSLVHNVLSKRLRPFYFVYTLLNPNNLGKEIIRKYVGDNENIQREVTRLSTEWPLIRTDSSFSYIDMTDKLFSKGLEFELPIKEMRIMTPYTDYELQKYVSMLRRLIEKGYKLYILCRLASDPRPWNVLKDSLLKGLGDKSASVKIRTYTRFKEFLPASKLTKLDELQRKEFGVHAKLFIIGDADKGAVLLGSANLLENSYNWNPECGLYTEDPTFIESAKAFFDFVWDLSEHDAVDLSRLDRIPKGPFFPHCYFR